MVPLDYILTDYTTEATDGWHALPPSPALYLLPMKPLPSHTLSVTMMLIYFPTNYDAMLIQRFDFLGLEIYRTYDIFFSSPTLLLVSDSRVNNYMGSMGWIIPDTDTERRLVQGSGSSPNHNLYLAGRDAIFSGLSSRFSNPINWYSSQ
jgi:hypothetical protein